MPEISLFFGIKITMHWNEHNPPHFHVDYANYKALVDIQRSVIIRGFLPSRQLKLVLAWCELHQDELMQNWEFAKENKPLNEIAPLS
ncbi:MAG: DUF4160 domain-containing protein [Coriobacteriales bacterium]|jgi:hypothetical protein|nr:DUF4160 domain-containing protein [Coriobacteriales bacterium]